MAPAYLTIVNKVLRRLREPTVTTVNETAYSQLIGDFVNDTKREVEDAWNWEALRITLTATTTAQLFNYVLVDAGNRLRILNAWNDTDNFELKYASSKWFDEQFLMSTSITTGSPTHYTFNGIDTNGDIQIDLYPVPSGVFDLRFNCVKTNDPFTTDSETTIIPDDIIVHGALARALSERGMDGGNQEAEMRYKLLLADYIAMEAHRRPEELEWSAS